jgi:dihydrolipoamide dehydrogenase
VVAENGHFVGDDARHSFERVLVAVEMGAVADDVVLSMHPHPTLSEGEEEAAEPFLCSATHILGRRQNKTGSA